MKIKIAFLIVLLNASSAFGQIVQVSDSILFENMILKNELKSTKQYIENFPQGKYIDSAKKMLEIQLWANIENSENINDFLNFNLTFPNSKFRSKSKEKEIQLAWELIEHEGSLDNLNEFNANYPNSKFKFKCDSLMNQIALNQISDSSTTEELLEFKRIYSKSPYISKIDSLLSLKNRSAFEENMVSEINNSNLSQRIAYYKKSKSSFVRTYYINNKEKINQYVLGVLNNSRLNDYKCIKEIWIDSQNVLFYEYTKPYLTEFLKYNNNHESPNMDSYDRLYINHLSIAGLGFYCNMHLNQQFSSLNYWGNNGFLLNLSTKSSNLIVDPTSKLQLYSLSPFPIIRLSNSNPIGEKSWSERYRMGRPWGLSDAAWDKKIRYISDPLLSLNSFNVFTPAANRSEYKIFNNPNTNNFIFLGDDIIYNYDFKKIRSVSQNSEKKILTFNDSTLIFLLDSGILIESFEDEKVSRKIKFSISKNDIIYFAQIDKFNKYCYIEYCNKSKESYEYLSWIKEQKKSPIVKDELIVIDIQKKKIVFLGPKFHIDYLEDKIGHFMTAPEFKGYNDKYEKVIVKTTKPMTRIKSSLPLEYSFLGNVDWYLENNEVDFDGKNYYRNLKVINRNLIDISQFFSESFIEDLNNANNKITVENDIFNVEKVKFQNQFNLDSLKLIFFYNYNDKTVLRNNSQMVVPMEIRTLSVNYFDSIMSQFYAEGESAVRKEEFQEGYGTVLLDTFFTEPENMGRMERFNFIVSARFDALNNGIMYKELENFYNCLCREKIHRSDFYYYGRDAVYSYKGNIEFEINGKKDQGEVKLNKEFITKKDSIYEFKLAIQFTDGPLAKLFYNNIKDKKLQMSIFSESNPSFFENKLDYNLAKIKLDDKSNTLGQENYFFNDIQLRNDCGLSSIRYNIRFNTDLENPKNSFLSSPIFSFKE
jgi:hypothetical protein